MSWVSPGGLLLSVRLRGPHQDLPSGASSPPNPGPHHNDRHRLWAGAAKAPGEETLMYPEASWSCLGRALCPARGSPPSLLHHQGTSPACVMRVGLYGLHVDPECRA